MKKMDKKKEKTMKETEREAEQKFGDEICMFHLRGVENVGFGANIADDVTNNSRWKCQQIQRYAT